ncbi:DinB family protein [Arthrobacter sp. 35W]|uniref:DinB family protein n=1 Tax=Arthrobacter sp. 35W TaxID=1132441 RepID=UPI00040449EC|nr:DinB family protein [Arthrobacter sp. 35W]
MTGIDWTTELVDQLDWHWTYQARARLEGLSDAEYFWEPVPGWNVRRRTHATPADAPGSGAFTIDFIVPEPDPAPLTTIAWRLSHLQVGVLGARLASHFGGPQVDYQGYDYPGTAAVALDRLDGAYAAWIAGVRSLGEAGLARPCGPAEGPYASSPMATLVLHINREMIHHLAEAALLRDLYANQH